MCLLCRGVQVAGGAVATSDPTSAETSVTPAWRRAAMHVVFGTSWGATSSVSDIQTAFTGATQLAQAGGCARGACRITRQRSNGLPAHDCGALTRLVRAAAGAARRDTRRGRVLGRK